MLGAYPNHLDHLYFTIIILYHDHYHQITFGFLPYIT